MTAIRDRLETWFNGSPRGRRIGSVVLLVAAIALAGVAIKKALTRELDLYVILSASRDMLTGENIYAVRDSLQYGYYVYLPLLAFLFIPLALLPPHLAAMLWVLTDLVLISWSLHTFIKLIVGDAHLSRFEKWSLYLLPLIFAFDAVSADVGNAQVNSIILASSVLALKLADRGKDRWAGSLLGLAAVAKVFTLPLIFYTLLRGRWKITIGSAIGVVAGLIAPIVVIGYRLNLDYITFWLTNVAFHPHVATHRAGFLANTSTEAVLTRLFSHEPAYVINEVPHYLTIADQPGMVTWAEAFLPVIPLVLLVIYAVINRSRSKLISWWGGVALAFCLAPLIPPVAERHHFLLLLPAYAYVSYLWIHVRLKGRCFYVLLATAFALSTLTLKVWIGEPVANICWALGAPSWAAYCLAAAIFYGGSALGKETDKDHVATR